VGADCREFQEEVESRMREEMQGASSPVSQPASPSNGSSPFGNFGQSQKAPVQLVKIPAPDIQVCKPSSVCAIVGHSGILPSSQIKIRMTQ
jgi:hypothetical protein